MDDGTTEEEWVDVDDSGIKMEKKFAEKEGYIGAKKEEPKKQEPAKRSFGERLRDGISNIRGAIERYEADAPKRREKEHERRTEKLKSLQFQEKELSLRNKIQSLQQKQASRMPSNPFMGGFGSFSGKPNRALPNPMTLNPWGKTARKIETGKFGSSSLHGTRKKGKRRARIIIIR